MCSAASVSTACPLLASCDVLFEVGGQTPFVTSFETRSTTLSGSLDSSSRTEDLIAFVIFFCNSEYRIGLETVYAVTWNPSFCSWDLIEAVSDISMESSDGRGLRGTVAFVGETTPLGEVGLSGVTIPVLPREDDGVIEVEPALALAPKNDENGLIRPNLAGGALSLGLSFSLADASSIGVLFSGGNGRMAVSVDMSYVGKNVDEGEVQVGRRAEIAVCRRAVSLTACMMVESGGKIDSKQILLPRIVPNIPDRDTNMLGGSSSFFRLVSLPLLGRLDRASGDTTKTMWSRSICGVIGNDDAGVVGKSRTAYY